MHVSHQLLRFTNKRCYILLTSYYVHALSGTGQLIVWAFVCVCACVRVCVRTVQTFIFCTSRPDVCQWLVVQIPMNNMSQNKSSTSMTNVFCELNLRSVVRLFKYPCPGNWMAIGFAVVYNDWAAQAFGVGIKCWHCSCAVGCVIWLEAEAGRRKARQSNTQSWQK